MLGKMIDGRIKALCEGAAQSEDSALGGPRATEPDSSLPRHGARELLSTPPKHQQQRQLDRCLLYQVLMQLQVQLQVQENF